MTRYEKNSRYIAGVAIRSRRKQNKLKGELIAFFSALSIICTGLYIIISSISY